MTGQTGKGKRVENIPHFENNVECRLVGCVKYDTGVWIHHSLGSREYCRGAEEPSALWGEWCRLRRRCVLSRRWASKGLSQGSGLLRACALL